MQGMGLALFEEMVWDSGRVANPTMMDYKLPSLLDLPPEIHAIIREDPEPMVRSVPSASAKRC